MITERGIVEAWLAASRDLNIKVIAPFNLRVDGRDQEYLALVPHFAGGKGMVVAALPRDATLYAHAKSAGYHTSFVNPEVYSAYNREVFVETLTEWGFTGPEDERPGWLAPLST